MSTLERRKLGTLEARASDKPGIAGYAAIYGGEYVLWEYPGERCLETIKPGAFDRALREKQDVRCLYNHEPDNLLGRTKAGTLTLSVDSKGLHYDCNLNPESALANEVRGMVQRGDLDGCSFSFEVTKQSWSEEKSADGTVISRRVIEDVNLYDVGPVTFPAYEATSVDARSLFPNGVPAEVRSHVPGIEPGEVIPPVIVPPAEIRSENGCECDCPSCEDGDCADCTADPCGDLEHCQGGNHRSFLFAKARTATLRASLTL